MAGLRLTLSAALATILVGSLFWFLHFLIGRQGGVGEVRTAARIEFSRLRRDTEVQSRRQEKARLELPRTLPTPQLAVRGGPEASGPGLVMPLAIQAAVPVATQKLALGARLGGGSDRDAVPLVRIEPEYPSSALERGVEGWVLVRFSITSVGTVKDAAVVEASPPGIFDAAAVKAVLRWKYNPRIEDGTAVERRGIQVVLRFHLEGGK